MTAASRKAAGILKNVLSTSRCHQADDPALFDLAKEQNKNIMPAMVARSYLGLLAPEQDFERLRAYRDQLLTMAQAYRPGGAEYMALSRAVMALDEAAGIVMNKPGFYQSRLHKTT